MATTMNLIKRGFSSTAALNNTIKHVTVIGGGLMGSGIAQVAAQSGNLVVVVDINDDALKKTSQIIEKSLGRVAKTLHKDDPQKSQQFLAQTLANLTYSKDLSATVSQTDLVVEAIVENLDAKHKVFRTLDEAAAPHTLLTSNTSSLSIKEITDVVQRKDKCGGLHFFNPVPMMKLLEVIRIPETSDDSYEKMMAWGKSVGKVCVTCKDTPGFVVNRLLASILTEAARMLERGDATARDIDTAMKLGCGHPMGPLELCDYVGLDTQKFCLDGWHEKFPENQLFEPIGVLNKLVGEGKFGMKTGEGYYNYKKK